jgi:hypothetical protein
MVSPRLAARRLLFGAYVVAAVGCRPPAEQGRVRDQAGGSTELKQMLESYGAAFEARDVTRVMSLYAEQDQFQGYSDGQPVRWVEIRDGLAGFLQSIDSVVVRYDTIDARLLSPEVGVVWAALRESWVDSTGTATAVGVSGSWILRRIRGRWRIVYIDLRHGPAPPQVNRVTRRDNTQYPSDAYVAAYTELELTIAGGARSSVPIR